jgi:hypothetical protein
MQILISHADTFIIHKKKKHYFCKISKLSCPLHMLGKSFKHICLKDLKGQMIVQTIF